MVELIPNYILFLRIIVPEMIFQGEVFLYTLSILELFFEYLLQEVLILKIYEKNKINKQSEIKNLRYNNKFLIRICHCKMSIFL